ncbi:MAG: hypothetical protein H6741_16045 [Alphaproteobacteria bacterium]|nr:hypothetical protein [Alphaproteobacteria bacterium]MCB9794226.1 hypothetical protein [Alphaproteobacteria bacterium]
MRPPPAAQLLIDQVSDLSNPDFPPAVDAPCLPAAAPDAGEHPGCVRFVHTLFKRELTRPVAQVPESLAWAEVDGERVAVTTCSWYWHDWLTRIACEDTDGRTLIRAVGLRAPVPLPPPEEIEWVVDGQSTQVSALEFPWVWTWSRLGEEKVPAGKLVQVQDAEGAVLTELYSVNDVLLETRPGAPTRSPGTAQHGSAAALWTLLEHPDR